MSGFVFLNLLRSTDNKVRWQGMVEDVKFDFYIPKWRVPRPWPKRILVHVCDLPAAQEAEYERADRANPASLERGITTVVRKVARKTETVKFKPEGHPDDWEIGSPYIPNNILPSSAVEVLKLQVWWDRSADTSGQKLDQ